MLNVLISKIYKTIYALVTRRVTIKCDSVPYEFNNVPYKKIWNWILVEASLLAKPERPWGWPTHFQIEPSNSCNLSCALCPINEGMKRPRGHMDPELFKKLIDEAGDYIFLILLWDWGEPFVNPDIYEMISYAKKKGIKLVSSTNGHAFVREENADKLIRSGIDSIIFAMDGITQETYSRYRQGGKLESVLKGIKAVAQRKRALGSQTPLINLRFIPMRHNEHEVPELKKLAASIGVDVLTIKTLNPYSDNTYGDKKENTNENWVEFLPDNPAYRRFEYLKDGRTRIRLKKNPCKQLWNAPIIHRDGEVCICTYDYDERFTLGNIKNNSFKSIWYGEAYRNMRRQFRIDWEGMPQCRECSYAYKGGSCIDEIIADAFFFKPEKTN